MPRFKYVAETTNGETVKGVEEAPTATGLRSRLFDRQLRVVEMKPAKSILAFEFTKKKLPRQELMHFSRQLAAFIRAGVPILEALQVVAEETKNKVLSAMLDDVRESLTAGTTLSDALSRHTRHMPVFYLEMIRSAELTGKLDAVLDQLSRYIERDLEARRKIRSALIYPAMVMVMSVVTVVVLTTFVLPRFRTFFDSLNARLPLPTRILLTMSDFLGQWWWAIVAFGIIVTIGGIAYIKTPRGQYAKDEFILRIPIAGEVARFAIIERFCRILTSMIGAGVPMPDAMRVVSEGTGSVVYSKALMEVREAMIQGEGLSRPIAETGLFPASVTQMIRVGEDTGTLEDQLDAAAQYYDHELDYKIKRLTALFEPMVIIVMGVIVGFVAVALISAMYGVFRQTGTDFG